MSNIAGIGVTVPHKIAAASLCDSMSEAARAVGAVNSIQRTADGAMHGALFDGIGFVQGLGAARERLAGADVLLLGAGGAGRAIAHALAGEGLGRLRIVDLDPAAVEFTADMANRTAGARIAGPAEAGPGEATVWINATPMGLRAGDVFPVDLALLSARTLVADIASLSRETELLKRARALGCATSDGNDMLNAQIALIAGFAAGLEPGEPLS
jgi:shikimate dehydrogenase